METLVLQKGEIERVAATATGVESIQRLGGEAVVGAVEALVDQPSTSVPRPALLTTQYVRAETALQLLDTAFALGVAACRSPTLAMAARRYRCLTSAGGGVGYWAEGGNGGSEDAGEIGRADDFGGAKPMRPSSLITPVVE